MALSIAMRYISSNAVCSPSFLPISLVVILYIVLYNVRVVGCTPYKLNLNQQPAWNYVYTTRVRLIYCSYFSDVLLFRRMLLIKNHRRTHFKQAYENYPTIISRFLPGHISFPTNRFCFAFFFFIRKGPLNRAHVFTIRIFVELCAIISYFITDHEECISHLQNRVVIFFDQGALPFKRQRI